MTKKFDTLFESILGDLASSATITPVPLAVSTDTLVGGCDGEDCNEVVDDEVSETEIATKIIKHIKALRKQIGEDTYYRARKIQELAEKLLEMHPDIEIIEPQGEE